MTPAEEQALTALKPTLVSLDPKTVAYPDMPTPTFVIETHALTETWLKHTARYVSRGIDTAILANKLENGVRAFAAADYLYHKAASKEGEAKGIWDQNEDPARDLLAEALSCLDYILPANCDARREMDSILEGTGNADMIMDLGRTAALCREFASPLTKAAFTETMTEQLQAFYVTLTEAYGIYSSDKKDVTPELDLRNRAFTYCKSIETEMKKAAKMVFRKEPEILAQYRSEYQHGKYLRYRVSQAEKKAKELTTETKE